MIGIHARVAAPAVVLLLACVGCGGGGSNAPTTPTAQPSSQPSGPAPAATDVSISIVADAGVQSFNPNPSGVRMGQTVAWRNTDTLVHHIVEDSADTNPGGDGGYGPGDGGGASGFDGGQQAPGAVSGMLTARAAGTMHYHCSIHPGMVGTLTVTQ